MRIGLVDVDSHNFPNLPLMKISAWHKGRGDSVEWYEPLLGHFDKVYLSKVFSFTPDYDWPIYADEVVRGGSGYCIKIKDGMECWDNTQNTSLPYEIEHIYPDYSLYGITDTAYGFMSRGCPRGCDFCHVARKEGRRSYKVADLSEFWRGQKNIIALDPNVLACPDWSDILHQVRDSHAWVEFNQGFDIRVMDVARTEAIMELKIKMLHFAWDKYEDGDMIKPRFKMFKERSGIDHRKLLVYVLCAYNTTIQQDLERIYWLRDNGYEPFVMLYNKENLPRMDIRRKMVQWCNNKFIFHSCLRFEDFERGVYEQLTAVQ